MKKIIIILLLILLPMALAVSNPVIYNGKTYYIVTSTDASEDTGNEVCAKIGQACNGYIDTTTAVCKQFHPSAAETSSLSGDKAGVYCDGSPQSGVCSTKLNTCHVCPACTNTVDCKTPIGNLYREMFVECVANQGCKISLTAKNVNEFFNEIPSLNAQLKGCPQQLPKGSGLLLSNGNTVVNIAMNNGQTNSFTIIGSKGQIIGIKSSGGPCVQRIAINENDFNSILTSSNTAQTVSFLIAQKKITISGCNFLTSVKLFFTRPIVKFIANKQAPSQPAPKPPPNCGNIGEQCNNRACFSGICAAPKENINGQWRFVNYRCLSQSDWAGRCEGRGNTPAPWHCITGPCT